MNWVKFMGETYLDARKVIAEERGGSEGLVRRDVTTACHDDIRLFASIWALCQYESTAPSSIRMYSPVEAQSQIPRPFVQWAIAASMSKNCRWFCLSATMTLT